MMEEMTMMDEGMDWIACIAEVTAVSPTAKTMSGIPRATLILKIRAIYASIKMVASSYFMRTWRTEKTAPTVEV